ncbi:histone deacetylase 6-like, partial [Cygnus olor]|uniref:histone deacetylase 6-like n=1 Tax=Cygnus olor TaxID=8869 RepID=UPI001ADE5A77
MDPIAPLWMPLPSRPGWPRSTQGCSASSSWTGARCPAAPPPACSRMTPAFSISGCTGVRTPPPSVGTGRGEGFTVDLRWEEPGTTDGDYAAAFLQLLLPIALEFQPQLVLVNAAVDAALGDPEGRVGVSPDGISLLTHLLAALAGGCLLLTLQGGSQPGALPGGLSAVLRTLLGDPGDPPGPMTPTPRGLGSIARTLEAHRKYWSGLRCEPDVEDEPEDEEREEERELPEGEEVPGGDEGPDPPLEEVPDPPLEPPGGDEGPRPTARTGLLYDERMEEHCNPWDSQHPEAPQRVARVLQRLTELGLAQRCLRLPARPALRSQLLACHTRAHVAALAATEGLRARELRGAAARYNSVFLCPRSYACARLAAGTACAAVTAVLRGQ